MTTRVRATVADILRPAIEQVLGGPPPLTISFWDGSELVSREDRVSIRVCSPQALRQIAYAPGALGIGRAYVSGNLELEGDMLLGLRLLHATQPRMNRLTIKTLIGAIGRLPGQGVFGKPVPVPAEEARRKGRFRHLRSTDREAISHHYDIPSEFYELFLGESMAYTSARYPKAGATLDEAQFSKYDLVCRKLNLSKGDRLLDIGCGWGGLCMFAARNYGVSCVGITISTEQAAWARKAVATAGLDELIEVRVCDYRDLADEQKFDAVSAIGVLEHIGAKNSPEFFSTLKKLLVPAGRVVTQAISKVGGAPINEFGDRYIFPDGELQDVAGVVEIIEQAGLEVRDVEGLREHYAVTCEAWTRNLEANWDAAVALVGLGRARVWRLHLAASSVLFERNRIAVFQTLAVNTSPEGYSAMPLTRASYV